MYQIGKLTRKHHHLFYEYRRIIGKFCLNKKKIMDVCFLYNDTLNNNINEIKFYKEEKFMYFVKNASSYCVEREEIELPIRCDNYQFSYIIIYLEDLCMLARFGTTEVDYEAEDIFLYDNKKYMTIEDIESDISDEKIKKLILSNFHSIV